MQKNRCAYCKTKEAIVKYCSRLCACRARNTSTHQSIAGSIGAKYNIAKRGSAKKDTYIKYYGRHEHRVAAEKMCGRRLAKEEIVHHINGNRHDNRPENLKITTRSEHMNFHRQGLIDGRKK